MTSDPTYSLMFDRYEAEIALNSLAHRLQLARLAEKTIVRQYCRHPHPRLTTAEIAASIGVSTATVWREQRLARDLFLEAGVLQDAKCPTIQQVQELQNNRKRLENNRYTLGVKAMKAGLSQRKVRSILGCSWTLSQRIARDAT